MNNDREVAAQGGAMIDAKSHTRMSKWRRLSAPRGVSTVEYALLALGVIAVVAVVIALLEGGILGFLGNVSDRITAAAT